MEWQWREHMGVEPTGDAEGRRPTVLKTAPTTGQDVLPGEPASLG